MAYQKLQVGRALPVIPSDTVLIPDVSTEVFSGIADFSAANTLTDASTTFKSIVSSAGAIVYNTGNTPDIAYNVTSVNSDTVLKLSPATTGGATDAYTIYNAATTGCVLYVGVAGNLKVQTSSGDIVTFTNMPIGFVPVQVIQVFATGTGASGIIALW
jgi:phosphoribosylcarboxyaminoimidazole (NCAIR) mutase